MPSEATRCMDCGTALKAVPSWLATAKVNFTCSACPRRSSRGAAAAAAARFDKPVEAKSSLVDDDLDVDEIEDVDEDAELDIAADELDDVKDDVEL